MFCTKCGQENKAEAKFCGACGAELVPVTTSVPPSLPNQVEQEAMPAKPSAGRSKLRAWLLTGAFLALIPLGLIGIITYNNYRHGLFGAGSESASSQSATEDLTESYPVDGEDEVGAALISVLAEQECNNMARNAVLVECHPILTIKSLTDEITIQSVQINRGNCEWLADFQRRDAVFQSVYLPKRLGYGEVVSNGIYNCDGILEAIVETDRGSWTFGFSP